MIIQGHEFVSILLTINLQLRDNNLHLYSKSSPCILKLSYKTLSIETVSFQTHKLLPLLCRPANLKQELISGLEITAGQRTMSGLIVDLTGQTFVLPVMLTGQNSVVLKMK